MKVLLIVPPNSQKERYGNLSLIGTLYPQLGLAYLASIAEQEAEVRVIDSEAMNYSYIDISRIIKEFNPDLIGMSVYFTTINRCYRVADIAKKISPQICVVIGGAQVTLDKTLVKNPNIDFGIYGEGEISFKNLLRCIKYKKDLSKINSLIWKRGQKLIINPPEKLITNLDKLPFPARHLFPMEKYHSSANIRGNKTLNIMTSRGCPYKCTYCAGSLIFGGSFRYHSTERVIAEIKELINKYHADNIQFYDETFTANRERVIELCNKMIKSKLNVQWSCFTRVNLVDAELLKKMKQAGCYLIFYGLESGVQRLLNIIKKGITLEQSRRAMKLTHEAGIETWASFMIDLPSETREESEQTIKFALEVDPTFVQFPITTPYPGTPMYSDAKKYGQFLTDNWEEFTAWDVVYISNGRNSDEIKKVVKNAYKRFYLRPRYILRRTKSILKLPTKKIINLALSAILTFIK